MVLVDHLGFLITSGDDERAQIENIVRQLAVVAYSLKVQIILIAHPRTLSSGAERVTMNDLKGASAIKQDASEVLVVVREPPRPNASPPRVWPGSWIHVEKNRSEFGTAGSKALLAFGPLSLIYGDTWEDVPEGKTGSIIGIP
jgi:replicative DNA helicase